MKKRILAGVMGLAMLLTACGGGASSSTAASTPASSAASSAAAVSGTFEGSSVGMQGTVTVSMTVEDGKITAVELTECHETPSIASVAMERLPQLMVEHQTTTLDNVTGATLASGAIMRAATAAAEAAGLDMDQLEANAYSEPAGEDETWDTDVLVVGGGGAGFSSAITAAQEGADVILIEKSSVLGGNTLMQGGAFNAVDTVAQSEVVLTEAQKGTLDSYLALSTDDPDLHFDEFPEWAEVLTQLQSDINTFYAENAGTTAGVDMPGFDSIALHMWHIYVGGLRQMNDGTWMASDIDLARQLAESALGTFEWMRDGLGLNAPSGEGAGSDLFTVLGAMWPRTHPVETSTELIDKLRDVAEAAGVTIYTETAATSLLTDDTGRVIGATAEQANGTKITINTTKGVVLRRLLRQPRHGQGVRQVLGRRPVRPHPDHQRGHQRGRRHRHGPGHRRRRGGHGSGPDDALFLAPQGHHDRRRMGRRLGADLDRRRGQPLCGRVCRARRPGQGIPPA